jgi:hypothetical protein
LHFPLFDQVLGMLFFLLASAVSNSAAMWTKPGDKQFLWISQACSSQHPQGCPQLKRLEVGL